jgi:3-oxoacid CoA-transferase
MRAGGAGIPAFYTPTGVGTLIEQGGFPIRIGTANKPEISSQPRERKIFGGKEYILENSIVGDFALIKGWKADKAGNLVFRKSARNFNPDVATAGKICIAEVEEIVPVGSFDPDQIHIPSVYVHRIIKAEINEKRIEFKTLHVEG